MDAFNTQILDDIELGSLDEADSNEMVDKMNELLLNRLLLRAAYELDENEMKELDEITNKYANSDDLPAKIFSYLKEHMYDFDELIQEEKNNIKVDMEDEVEFAKQKIKDMEEEVDSSRDY